MHLLIFRDMNMFLNDQTRAKIVLVNVKYLITSDKIFL